MGLITSIGCVSVGVGRPSCSDLGETNPLNFRRQPIPRRGSDKFGLWGSPKPRALT
jgi:hypothetical protein